MTKCIVCQLPIERGRVALGYKTCKLHGDRQAQHDIAEKQKRVAPIYNKGIYFYLGSSSATGVLAKGIGKKTLDDMSRVEDPSPPAAPRERVPQHRSRPPRLVHPRPIGTCWFPNGDCRILREGDDPKAKGACRWVYYQS